MQNLLPKSHSFPFKFIFLLSQILSVTFRAIFTIVGKCLSKKTKQKGCPFMRQASCVAIFLPEERDTWDLNINISGTKYNNPSGLIPRADFKHKQDYTSSSGGGHIHVLIRMLQFYMTLITQNDYPASTTHTYHFGPLSEAKYSLMAAGPPLHTSRGGRSNGFLSKLHEQ